MIVCSLRDGAGMVSSPRFLRRPRGPPPGTGAEKGARRLWIVDCTIVESMSHGLSLCPVRGDPSCAHDRPPVCSSKTRRRRGNQWATGAGRGGGRRKDCASRRRLSVSCAGLLESCHLHEKMTRDRLVSQTADGRPFIGRLPAKFRKVLWVKPGGCEPPPPHSSQPPHPQGRT